MSRYADNLPPGCSTADLPGWGKPTYQRDYAKEALEELCEQEGVEPTEEIIDRMEFMSDEERLHYLMEIREGA